jgi:hypothetical protein
MARTLAFYEDAKLRAEPEQRVSICLYRRIFNIPKEAFDLVPAWGQLVSADDVGLTDLLFPFDPNGATALQAPRVMGVSLKKNVSGWQHVVTFYQPILAAGQTKELRGSPEFPPGGTMLIVNRKFVTVNGVSDLAVSRGSLYTGDTLPSGRVVTEITDDTESFPGLHHHVVRHEGYRLKNYTSGNYGEIEGSPEIRDGQMMLGIARRFVSVNGNSDLPMSRGSYYGSDSGPAGRVVTDITDDPSPTVLGVHVHTITYKGYRALGTPSANYCEILGSPRLSPSATMKAGVRLFLSLNGLSDLPFTRGDLFPGDSLVGGRVIISISDEPEVLPGIHMHSVVFQGFEPMVSWG